MDDLGQLSDALALLHGEAASSSQHMLLRPCFCQGTKHARHPFGPLCTSCGLIICVTVSPSPLLGPEAPCPSCGEAVLDERSRAMLVARLDERMARMVGEQEEAAARVRRERELARAGRRNEAELFPHLNGASSGSLPPSASAAGYTQYHDRRRQIDIAMGRRIDDTEEKERRVRVVRIGSKPNAPNPTAKKKGKGKKAPGSVATSKSSPLATTSSPRTPTRIDEVLQESASSDVDSADMGEEQIVVHFDKSDDPLAPVSDPYDRGFLTRWMGNAPEQSLLHSSTADASKQRWTARDPQRTVYVPPEHRRSRRVNTGGWRDQIQEDEGQDIATPIIRSVPGSSQAVSAA